MENKKPEVDLFGQPIIDSKLKDWQGMPEFIQNDTKPVQQIVINFETYEAVQEFAKLYGNKISRQANSLWFPYKGKTKYTEGYIEEKLEN